MDQASRLRELMSSPKIKRNTHFIAVTSGKGGVGKSTLSANLSNILAKNGYKVVLFDADIGLANLDIILNVRVEKNLLDVMSGKCTLKDILIDIKPNFYLIPGESGTDILKFNDKFLFEKFLNDAASLNETNFVIVDTGAGIGNTTQIFLDICDEVIVITTPDPSSITDAYATVKTISKQKKRIYIMPNMVLDENEAKRIFGAIKKTCLKTLGDEIQLEMLGYIQNDKLVSKSIKDRTLFSDTAPHTEPSVELKNALNRLLINLEQKVLDNSNDQGVVAFFKRLAERFN